MTIRDMFDAAVAEAPSSVMQRYHDGKDWTARTYAEARSRVGKAAALVRRSMGDAGVKDAAMSGETGLDVGRRAAIMMENSPDWVILYLALAGSGFTVVPVDPKLRAGEVRHILSDSGAQAVFCGERQAEVVDEVLADLPSLVKVVNPSALIDGIPEKDAEEASRWYDANRPGDNTLASLIYTSGTTGRPKGAMLTHSNFVENVMGTIDRVKFYPTDSFINVLPLFHAFSFMGNFLLPMAVKGETSFIRTLRTIADDMLAVKPTILLSVPLLAEKLYARIDAQIRKSVLTKGLFKVEFARKYMARKIVERFGGRMRLIGIGGAPTSIETLEGFRKIGLFVLEGYGITECAPGVAYPEPSAFVAGTVGPVLSNMQWKVIGKDEHGAGELCVKGPNVMKGYWRKPEQTAAAFDEEGYYKTGDIVKIDANGNVKICGRTKALIVNREGKNIYPEEIERALEHAPLIKDAIVLGYKVGSDPGEHVGAIIVPDEDAIRLHFKGETLTREDMAAFITEYAQGVCRAAVADYKQPRKFDVRFDPLERTGTMKVRRVVYAGQLDETPPPKRERDESLSLKSLKDTIKLPSNISLEVPEGGE